MLSTRSGTGAASRAARARRRMGTKRGTAPRRMTVRPRQRSSSRSGKSSREWQPRDSVRSHAACAMSVATVTRFAQLEVGGLGRHALDQRRERLEHAGRLGEALVGAAHRRRRAAWRRAVRATRRRAPSALSASARRRPRRTRVREARPASARRASARTIRREKTSPSSSELRRETVRAVQPARGDLAGRVEAGNARAAVDVDAHAADDVVRRRRDREQVAREVVARLGARLPDRREARAQVLLAEMTRVEPHVVAAASRP